MKRLLIVGALGFSLIMGVGAVEIPLDREKQVEGKQEANIGYIDIDRVFSEHPMTGRLRVEYYAEADNKKREISEKEREITRLQQVLVASTTKVSVLKLEIEKKNAAAAAPPAEVAVSSATIENLVLQEAVAVTGGETNQLAAMEEGILGIKREIEKKKGELAKLVDINKEHMTLFEKEQTDKVLKDIYMILDRVAFEENITVIVDKNQILYGKAARDLTDRVLDRLRGR